MAKAKTWGDATEESGETRHTVDGGEERKQRKTVRGRVLKSGKTGCGEQ